MNRHGGRNAASGGRSIGVDSLSVRGPGYTERPGLEYPAEPCISPADDISRASVMLGRAIT